MIGDSVVQSKVTDNNKITTYTYQCTARKHPFGMQRIIKNIVQKHYVQ